MSVMQNIGGTLGDGSSYFMCSLVGQNPTFGIHAFDQAEAAETLANYLGEERLNPGLNVVKVVGEQGATVMHFEIRRWIRYDVFRRMEATDAPN